MRSEGDEALLRHILNNLLSNAVKYSPAGQSVRLRVRREGVLAVFEIEDRGIGIDAADQKHLFTAFQRGKNVGAIPGTGLGLVIVKRCVDLHGGMLNLDSRVNVGTRFTVRVALFAPDPVSKKATGGKSRGKQA